VVGASLDEVLKVRCHVTADPGDVSFLWQFNNSGENFEVEHSRFGTGNGSTSELFYTPKSERDYGTLTCWGRNAIGRQTEPCVFQLVPAGNKPESEGSKILVTLQFYTNMGCALLPSRRTQFWKC